jgi:hypothetical protein
VARRRLTQMEFWGGTGRLSRVDGVLARHNSGWCHWE